MRHFFLALGCVVVFATAARAQNPSIQMIHLGTALPGYETHAAAINSRGVVAGMLYQSNSLGNPKAFTWSRASGYRIVMDNASATDINDSGVVVGTRIVCASEGNCEERGFAWSASTGVTDLGAMHPTAINNKGTVVGLCDYPDGCMRTAAGEFRVLPLMPTDINERDAVIGTTTSSPDEFDQAAVWASSFGLRYLDLNPQTTFGTPHAINESGTVVGSGHYAAAPIRRATIWSSFGRIGAPQREESIAYGISDRGWIVGQLGAKPVYWLLGRRMFQLPTPAGSGLAIDVNDSGLIVGWVPNSSGGFSSVLWIVR